MPNGECIDRSIYHPIISNSVFCIVVPRIVDKNLTDFLCFFSFSLRFALLHTLCARQADRFYDGDIFIDAGESDAVLGIENKGAQTLHPVRTPDNIYEFKDVKPPKSGMVDSTSLRSPSSLGITHTTKTSSQASLQSGAISLKESPVTTLPRDITDKSSSSKLSERSLSTHPRGGGGRFDDGRTLLSNYEKSRETMTDESSNEIQPKPSTTPIPTARKTIKSSRTHLIEGIPQTEV